MYLFPNLHKTLQKRQNLRIFCANITFEENLYIGGIVIERVIYGDILMVINFSMDFLSLYITSKLLHIKPSQFKLTLSAVTGALYALLILFFNPNASVNFIFSIITAFLLSFIAFGKQTTKNIIKNTCVFFVVNFALGGGITAICNTLNIWKNSRNIMINGTFDVLYGDLPFGLLIFLAILCGAFSFLSGKIIRKKNTQKDCELTITLNKQSVTLKGLIDSGNLLKEPISGKPVIIATFNSLRKIIPPELFDLLKNKTPNIPYNCQAVSRIRIIPTSTVNDKGVLLGIFPDSVTLDKKNVDVYIAITNDKDSFGDFSAIVPNEIF